MLKVVPFEAWHMHALRLQAAQELFPSQVEPGHAHELERLGNAYTAIDGGDVLACAGLIEQWQGRAIAWALLAGDIGPHRFLRVSRGVMRALCTAPFHRIEAAVDCEFPQAIRWVHDLGFELEGKMRAFGVDKRDHYLYARVR
jgi:hypothetical protein